MKPQPWKLFAALALIVGCSSPDTVTQRDRLVVASDLDNAPFAWVDEQGTARGRDVEMMEQIAAELDRDLVWERMAFDELLPAVEAGRVDCVCATLGITPERAERVLFSQPYFDTTIAVVVRAGTGEPGTLDELAGRTVTAGAGTTSELALNARLPHARPDVGAKTDATTTERLLGREIDAAIMDAPAARKAARESDGRLVVLSAPLSVERYAIAIAPSKAALATEIDRALADVRAAGSLDELNDRFGLSSDR